MSRPRRPIRPVRLEIHLPEDLHTRLTILLTSPTEGRVPHGTWSQFFETLARNALAKMESQNAAVR